MKLNTPHPARVLRADVRCNDDQTFWHGTVLAIWKQYDEPEELVVWSVDSTDGVNWNCSNGDYLRSTDDAALEHAMQRFNKCRGVDTCCGGNCGICIERKLAWLR